MNYYIYHSIAEFQHEVYKCQGVIGAAEVAKYQMYPSDQIIITHGYKGDRILKDQTLYLDPEGENVLYALHGEHVGKAFVILDQDPDYYRCIEFLDYHNGLRKSILIHKFFFQEHAQSAAA